MQSRQRPRRFRISGIGAICRRRSAESLSGIHIIFLPNRNQVSGKSKIKAVVTYGFQLLQEFVPNIGSLLFGHQSIGHGHAVYVKEVVVVKLAVGTFPPSQNPGRWVCRFEGVYRIGSSGLPLSSKPHPVNSPTFPEFCSRVTRRCIVLMRPNEFPFLLLLFLEAQTGHPSP